MIVRILLLSVFVLALSTAAVAQDESAGSPSPEVRDGKARQTAHDRQAEELKQLQDGLQAKKSELARIHRKWVVVKGRTPSKEELKKFEKQQAKGAVDIKDNPFVNKSPLSSPGQYRAAYYKKLEEIRLDEERIARLKEELAGSNH